jgi:hypothetical protein
MVYVCMYVLHFYTATCSKDKDAVYMDVRVCLGRDGG